MSIPVSQVILPPLSSLGVHTFVLCVFSFLLGIYLGVELLGHVVALMFNILRNCQTAFHSLQPLLWAPGTMSSVPPGAALFTTVTPAAGWPDPQQVLNNYIG